MATIDIRGNGEIGSAVAGALYRAGHRVVVQHEPGGSTPPADRRELGGVLTKRARRLEDLARMVGCGRAIAEAIEPLQRVIDTVLAAILAASAVKLYRG
jgi:predicted dinucleotide-binding enzyme